MGDIKKTIAVVHGGLGHERQKSLAYGKKVLKILQNLGVSVLEMHLHPNGAWTIGGKTDNIEDSLKRVDGVWNCLVGQDGESGQVESICEKCKTKLLGHSVLHSHLSHDKKNLQLLLSQHKVKSPFGKVIHKKNYSKEKLKEIFATVGVPAIVKPNTGSGVWGVVLASNFKELEDAVELILSQDKDCLVEKLIKGRSVSCFIFEHNNLLHTHIKTHDGSELTREEQLEIRNESLYIHSILAFKHHVEYDFILTPKSLIFLESNSHPSLVDGYIGEVFGRGPVGLSEYIGAKI